MIESLCVSLEFLKEMEENTGFFGSIAAFFKNLLAAIIEFFQGLFGS